ncbi:GNAT family N-acetyltransferase [Pseudolysinimonas yzui]|uniref:N-acetyltransferase n=1 Tax=Pseudolysinimonas yzui TaxID=2708254 RepID=A0A8J3E0U7_9MICO|nr:GNAT family N-acetyltransferase [Pseudolysinimonas yzui]GHF04201.1 N-acetyltransferase [Pseudolysinimonas yzui]
MAEHVIRALSLETWGAYAALIEKHNGVWGGCWCTYFHEDTDAVRKKELGGPAFKRRMVELGIAHAALVFDGDQAIGWAEYGAPVELPNIYHRKERDASGIDPANYRITCFFVDRDHRRAGVAYEALQGALDLIAAAGGGVVESYPNTLVEGKKTSSSFLHNGTREMFERAGFEYIRPLGLRKNVVRKVIPAA